MLFDDDVVTDREPKPSALSGGFRGEKWVEHLLLHVSRNTTTVVANPDFHPITEALGNCDESWLVVAPPRLRMALRCRVEAVRNQVEERSRNFSWEQINLAGGRIKSLLHLDRKAPMLGPCVVVGASETFIDESIDIGGPMLPRSLTRM